MTRAAFQRIVDATVAGLPPEFRAKLAEVGIVIRAAPTPAELRAAEVPPGEGLYGLFVGRPETAKSVFDPPAPPDRVFLYQRPLEQDFPDPAELAREIRITLLHELGHFFGMSEDDLDRLGYG